MWEDGLIVVTLLHIHSHSSAARANNHVSLGVNISINTPSRNMGNNGDNCPEEEICKDTNKIVGGCQVEPNTFPWQVYVKMTIPDSDYFNQCGGTILCPNLIMTAAHCVKECDEYSSCEHNSCPPVSKSRLSVEVGKHRLMGNDGELYGVERVIPHPNYPLNEDHCLDTHDYDFTILELEGKIPLNTEKGSIAAAVYLPDPSDGGRRKNLVVSGWGHLKRLPGGKPVCRPEKLNAVELSQIEDETCQDEWGNTFKDDIMICVGSRIYPDLPTKGTCQGDSGGPNVWLDKSNDKIKHIGVVSFGGVPCTEKEPSVHAKMTAILNNWQWEGENMAKKLKECNAEACGAGQCMTGSDLDDFVKSRFFD